MNDGLMEKVKPLVRIGTFVIEVPALSEREGVPCAVLLRRLRGEHYAEYFREQSRLSVLMRRLRQARATAKAALAPAPEGTTDDQPSVVPVGEEEQKTTYQIIGCMRALLLRSVITVFVDQTDGAPLAYKVTNEPVGEHGDQEISLDLLENDYALLVNRLLVKSGLITEAPFSGPPDAGGAGSGGEAVRPAAEPVGESPAGGPAA